MRQCRRCKAELKNRTWLNGVLKQTNKRVYCYDCSPPRDKNYTTPAWRQEKRNSSKEYTCPTCQRQHDCKTRNKECVTCRNHKKRKAHKLKALKLKGHKCCKCGYNKCDQALEFHHIKEKSFTLSSCWHYSWSRIENELEKCILICSNCHRELHANMGT